MAQAQQRVDLVWDAPASVQTAPADKSAVLAGVLEWLVPTVGFAYAGDWKRGLPPAAVTLAGVVLFAATFEFHIFSESECNGTCTIGLLMAAGGRIWGIIDAVDTAKDFNRALAQNGLELGLMPGPAGLTLAASWRPGG